MWVYERKEKVKGWTSLGECKLSTLPQICGWQDSGRAFQVTLRYTDAPFSIIIGGVGPREQFSNLPDDLDISGPNPRTTE